MASSDLTLAPPAGGDISLRPVKRRYGEALIKVLLGLCALISVVTTIGIVASLLLPALEFFSEVNPIEFLTGTDWSPLATWPTPPATSAVSWVGARPTCEATPPSTPGSRSRWAFRWNAWTSLPRPPGLRT